jgi:hypothetical protein
VRVLPTVVPIDLGVPLRVFGDSRPDLGRVRDRAAGWVVCETAAADTMLGNVSFRDIAS